MCQIIELLEHRGILRFDLFVVNILEICTRKIMLMASDKLVAPVLVHRTLNHLFSQVFNHGVGRRQATISETID